jgi:hypothetical protein
LQDFVLVRLRSGAHQKEAHDFYKRIGYENIKWCSALNFEVTRGERQMGNIDKRKRLEKEVFTYRVTKNNSVFIDYNGRQVTTLKGKEAEKILNKINQAPSDHEVQLILAKVTGNFKRGNEKDATKTKKNGN